MLKKIEQLFKSTRLPSLLFLFLLPLLCYSDDWLNPLHYVTHTGKSSDIIVPPFDLKIKYRETVTTNNYCGSIVTITGFGYPVCKGNNLSIMWGWGNGICGYELNTMRRLWYNPDGTLGSDTYPCIGGENNQYVFAGLGHGGWYQWDIQTGGLARSWQHMPVHRGSSVFYNGFFYGIYGLDDGNSQAITCGAPYPVEDYSTSQGLYKWIRDAAQEAYSTQPFKLEAPFSGYFNVPNAYICIPCVAEDTVYYSWYGHLHAVDRETGNSKFEVGKPDQFMPSFCYENGKIYCTGTEGGNTYRGSINYQGILYCLDAKTGNEIWRYNYAEGLKLYDYSIPFVNCVYPAINLVHSVSSQPIVADGVVYFGSKDGYFFAVNAATGELKWKTRTEGKFSYVQTSCISGNTVYFTTWNKGVLYACNKDTGEIVWRFYNPDNVDFGPVIIANNKLIVTGKYGYVYIFEEASINAGLIQSPKVTLPTIVKRGESFNIKCKASPSVSGWTAGLKKLNTTVNLTVTASYDTSKALWNITAAVPGSAYEDMYDLYVSYSGGNDTSVNSVKVIKEIKSDYYFIHISAPTHGMGKSDLNTMLDNIKLINPEFVIITGNILGSSSESNFQYLTETLRKYNVPVYMVPGDTDCSGPADSNSHKLWESSIGARYFSFSYGDHKYVGVDTTDDSGKIGSKQMDFVNSELQGGYSFKGIFYNRDDNNQIPVICDNLGVNAALSFAANANTSTGVTPTIYLKTTSSCQISGNTNSGYLRIIKVSNNRMPSYNLNYLYYFGAYKPVVESILSPLYDGTSSPEGEAKAKTAKFLNHTVDILNNCRLDFVLPVSGSYITHPGEILSIINRGDGYYNVSVKYSSDKGVDWSNPYIMFVNAGISGTSTVVYCSDITLKNELSMYSVESLSDTPMREYVKAGRTYLRIFTADGIWPSFKINQKGSMDFLAGDTEKLDSTGLVYRGYYDVVKDNGKEYIDGDAKTDVLSAGKIISPEIGNIIRIKTETPTPYMKYCTYPSGGTGISVMGEAVVNEQVDYYSAYIKTVYVERKTLPLGDWQSVYVGTNNCTWKDTTAVSGTTYRYRMALADALGTMSQYTDEYEATMGGPAISGTSAVTTTNTAVISWTTNIASTSQVEYAVYCPTGYYSVNNTYGDVSRWSDLFVSPEYSTPVTTHLVTLTGLNLSTKYGYRVISKDASGYVNSYGSKKYPFLYFTTAGNSTTAVGMEGDTSPSCVFPGDISKITIYGLDGTGKRTSFPWNSVMTYEVTAGGGAVDPSSTTNSYFTQLITGPNEGVNTIRVIKTSGTKLTCLVNVTAAVPDHYKFVTPLTVKAGAMANITITAYSDVAETVILPVVSTNIKIGLKAMMGDVPTNPAGAELLSPSIGLSNGTMTDLFGYTKVETAGIRIKAVDIKGKTGLSDVITVIADDTKPSKVEGTPSKEQAAAGEVVTIRGKVLDIYGNQIKTSGTVITFAVTQGTGTLSLSTAVTNTNGEAAVTLTINANEVNSVQVSSGSLIKSNVIVRANTISSIGLTPETISLKAGTRCNILIEPKDGSNNPVAGLKLNVKITAGGGNLGLDFVVTDETGKASVSYVGNTVLVLNTIKVETTDTLVFAQTDITTIAGDTDHYTVSVPSPVNINTNFTAAITAKDRYENTSAANSSINIAPVMYDSVSSPAAGSLSVVSGTLSSGTITITNETYNKAEKIKIRVTDNNNVISYSDTADVRAGTVSTIETVFRKPWTFGTANIILKDCSTSIATGASLELMSFLKDASGNPVGSTNVTYTKNIGTLSSTVLTTDSMGLARNTYTSAAGTGNITLSSGVCSSTVSITGLAPAQITEPSNPVITNLSSSTNEFYPQLKDGSGNPISYGTVNYTKLSGTGTIATYNPAPLNKTSTSTTTLSSYITDNNGKLHLGLSDMSYGSTTVVSLSAGSGTITHILTITRLGYSLVNTTAQPAGLCGQSLQLSARVTNSSGQGVNGQTVNFTVAGGGGGLDNSSAVTDSSGTVTVNLTLGANEGSNIVNAEFQGIVTSVFLTGVKIGNITLTCDDSIMPNTAAVLKAKIFDLLGNPVLFSGFTINFSKVSGGGSLSASNAATTSTGEATIQYTAGGTPGAVALSASAAGVTGTAGLNVVSAGSLELSAYPVILLNNSGSSDITAILRDSSGYPVKGGTVSFSVVSGTGSFSSASGISDAFGVVTTRYQSVTASGNNTIRAACSSVTKDITIQSISSLPAGAKLKLVAPSSLQTTTSTSLNILEKDIYARVTDGTGAAIGVATTPVTFIAGSGTSFKKYASSTWSSVTTITSATDVLGKADFTGAGATYLYFYPVIGQNTITAVSGGLISGTVNILGTSTSPYILQLASDPSSVKLNSSSIITAKLTSGSVAVKDKPVNFSLGGAGSLSSTLATTDINGEARVVLYSFNSADINYVVNANSTDNLNASVYSQLTVPTGKSTVESFMLETASSSLINQPFVVKIKALDINGAPAVLSGSVPVTLSAVLAGDEVTPGSGSLSQTTAVITNNADSSVTISITYTAAENIKIKISGAGKNSLSGKISFTLSASSMTLTTLPKSCLAAQMVVVEGIVKDAGGRGVYNNNVTLTSTAGTLNILNCTSDSDGKFSALLTSPSSVTTTVVSAASSAIAATTILTTTSASGIASYEVTAPAIADIGGFSLYIRARDSSGNTVQCSPTVGLTVITGTGTLGIINVRIIDGTMTFTNTYSKVENPVAIRVIDGNNKLGTSGVINMANSMPIVTIITPSPATNLQINTITITGQNFYAGTSSSCVTAVKIRLGTDTGLSGWTCISDSVINSAVVPLKTKAGTYDVIVASTQGSNTNSTGKLILTTTAPAITTITPNTGTYSQSVTLSIAGSGFFGGTNSSDVSSIKAETTTITTAYSVASDTSITGVIIPGTLLAGTYNVVAATGGGNSAGVPYIVTAPLPVVSTITTNTGNNNVNNTIKITGSGFFGGAGSNCVTMIQLTGTSTLTITNTYSVISDTEIQNSIIPSGFAGGTYDVKVTTLAGISLTSANSKYTLVGVTAPVIATITPNTTGYSQSVTVTITGSSFYGGKSSSDVTAIKLYTSPTTTTITGYSVLSDTAINSIVIPNTINAGTYQMKVTSSMGEGSGVDFVVNPPAPVVTTVVSNSGYRHLTNTIGIYGSGFFGGVGSNKGTMLQMTGASTGTITNADSVGSDTEIQNAGITAGTYDVRVTTDGGTNTTSAIKYVALADTTAPTIVTAVVNTAAVNITFSEDVSLSTATIKGNYKVASPTGGAATDLTSATLTYANNVATITGVSYTQGNTFAVTVTGVQDRK